MGLPARQPGQLLLQVRRESDVPTVVAAVHGFCREAGFGAVLAAHVATAASELANNLWMHTTRGGQLLVRACSHPQQPGRHGVQLDCSDDGPGMADTGLAMRDGYSTAGGMGCGLPGVQRLMDDFEISSTPGQGTRVRACKWGAHGAARGAIHGATHGATHLAAPGQHQPGPSAPQLPPGVRP